MNDHQEEAAARQHFDATSAYWYDIYFRGDAYTGYSLRKQHEFILNRVAEIEGARHILDVGCGAGVTVVALAQAGYTASGVDIAPRMIERAREWARHESAGCDFNVASARRLPYADNQFDVVFALGLLSNIQDDVTVLEEMNRVLRPGGLLLVTVANLVALDMLISLPRSVPIMLNGTALRAPVRRIGNLGRILSRRPVKDVSALRFARSALPATYIQRIQVAGFEEVHYQALTFGPLMPLGFRVMNDARAVTLSERISVLAERLEFLHTLGTVVMFSGRKHA
jgi:ubiquinone/menaquinone biosynthesis C-methylase UbiE